LVRGVLWRRNSQPYKLSSLFPHSSVGLKMEEKAGASLYVVHKLAVHKEIMFSYEIVGTNSCE